MAPKSSTLSLKPPTEPHHYGEHKKMRFLATTTSKEVSAWHDAHKRTQTPQQCSPRGLGSCSDKKGDSNPAPFRVTDCMKLSKGWFAKVSSPPMQHQGFSTVWRWRVPATKVLLWEDCSKIKMQVKFLNHFGHIRKHYTFRAWLEKLLTLQTGSSAEIVWFTPPLEQALGSFCFFSLNSKIHIKITEWGSSMAAVLHCKLLNEVWKKHLSCAKS